MNTIPKELKLTMTTQEVALSLGMTDKEIRRLEKIGVLRRLRGTRKPMRFSGHQIQQWLEEKR